MRTTTVNTKKNVGNRADSTPAVRADRAPAHARIPRRPLILAAGVVGFAVVALFGLYVSANGSKRANPTGGHYRFAVGDPKAGQPAPPIVLASTAGGTFDLSTLKGKTVLLYFQEGVGCQPCWDQMRDIQTQRAEFAAAGIDEFVTITSNPLDLLTRKLAQDKIPGPVLADTGLAVSKTYHANQYGMMGDSADGHTFIVVGPDGVIRWRADYGGKPDFTMFVPVASLLADLKAGLAAGPAGS